MTSYARGYREAIANNMSLAERLHSQELKSAERQTRDNYPSTGAHKPQSPDSPTEDNCFSTEPQSPERSDYLSTGLLHECARLHQITYGRRAEPELFFKIARYYEELGLFQEAILTYNEMVENQPDPVQRVPIHEKIISNCYALERIDLAIGVYQRMIEEEESSVQKELLYERMIQDHYKIGEFEEAIGVYQEMIEHESCTIRQAHLLGKIANDYDHRLNNPEEATATRHQAIAMIDECIGNHEISKVLLGLLSDKLQAETAGKAGEADPPAPPTEPAPQAPQTGQEGGVCELREVEPLNYELSHQPTTPIGRRLPQVGEVWWARIHGDAHPTRPVIVIEPKTPCADREYAVVPLSRSAKLAPSNIFVEGNLLGRDNGFAECHLWELTSLVNITTPINGNFKLPMTLVQEITSKAHEYEPRRDSAVKLR